VNECKPLSRGAIADLLAPGAPALTLREGAGGRGLHSVPFLLNLSSPVHRVTQVNHECVLELPKLSSNLNECKPLAGGAARGPGRTAAAAADADAGSGSDTALAAATHVSITNRDDILEVGPAR
jgi:hypothetical protein